VPIRNVDLDVDVNVNINATLVVDVDHQLGDEPEVQREDSIER